MTIYLDTSAAAKLLVEESESTGLAAFLDSLDAKEHIISSALLETELRRFGTRLDLPQSAVTAVLSRVGLVEPDRSLFYEAGLLPGVTSAASTHCTWPRRFAWTLPRWWRTTVDSWRLRAVWGWTRCPRELTTRSRSAPDGADGDFGRRTSALT